LFDVTTDVIRDFFNKHIDEGTSVCGVDFTCDAGYLCGENNQCVLIPSYVQDTKRGGHVPFSDDCWNGLSSCDSNLRSAPTEYLVLPNGGGKIVVEIYSRMPIDGAAAFTMAGGYQVNSPDCCSLEYWGDQCVGVRQYDGYPVRLDIGTSIHGYLRIMAAMEEYWLDNMPVPEKFRMTIKIKDALSGAVLYTYTTGATERIFDKTFEIGDDFTSCIKNPNLAAVFPKALWPTYRTNPFC
jgi:hypothetical protein